MQVRGYIHLHSTYSYDSKLTLAELKDFCRHNKVDFLGVTEHEEKMSRREIQNLLEESAKLSDGDFVLIPGLEIDVEGNHILVIGISSPAEALGSVQKIIEYKKQGAIVILAHPHRNNFKLSADVGQLLDGIEIWNSQYDGKRAPRLAALSFYRKYAINHESAKAFAGLDLHRMSHFGGPAISCTIDDGSFNSSKLLQMLLSGDFYMERRHTVISSTPKFSVSEYVKLSIISKVSIFFINSFKLLSKVMAGLGFRTPQKIKEFLRKFI